ncbi:DUF2158 domain-containing protein [Bradyrhizobium sp. CNPSo 4016]|nr:DUF2158 domain-containing protein [Bradyrhizobium glycinis]
MTIHSISGDNVDCQWFTLDGELRSATFPIYMLMVIEGAADTSD